MKRTSFWKRPQGKFGGVILATFVAACLPTYCLGQSSSITAPAGTISSGTLIYEAANTITTTPNLVIDPSAQVTLIAVNSITMLPGQSGSIGFHVTAGSAYAFQALINPSAQTASVTITNQNLPASSPSKESIYMNGKLVATENSANGSSCATCYITAGRNSQWGSGNDTINQKFTGKERDSESGPDWFGARYYGSALGRWTSPDALNLTSARLVNPTNTLNKYIYGGNNPLKYIDRDGEDITIYYRPAMGGSNADFGHVYIGALNQDTGKVGFLDYYPAGPTDGLGTGAGAFNLGNMQDRAGQVDQYATLTIQTSPAQAQEVLDLIDKLKSGAAPDYKALSNNCTTVCEDVLHDLGLDFGDVTPYQFWADAYRKFGADQQLGTYNARWPQVSVPTTPGRDYGNPRNFGLGISICSTYI